MKWFLELIENLWPLLIILFFSNIGNFFGSGDKKKRQNTSPKNTHRAQEIRDEIKRRIEEQKIKNAKRVSEKISGEKPQRYEQGVPYQQQRHPAQEYSRKTTPLPHETPEKQAETEPDPIAQYTALLDAERRKVAETKNALKSARASRRKTPAAPIASERDDITAVLSDPRGARRALLYSEILGTPVGLRSHGKMGPLWDR